ncbi:hypothetical protein ACA910_017608 [Epithemia clementina (nom. ined.)]
MVSNSNKDSNNKKNIAEASGTSSNRSILIIGATGALGRQCLHHLFRESLAPQIHILCRNPTKLNKSDQVSCASIIVGDAGWPPDVERALAQSQADCVFLVTGSGSDLSKKANRVRQTTGQALAMSLKNPAFQNVKTVVVSSHGAGGSKIIVGLGIGSMISYHLRHVLKDHDLQELAFADLMNRTLIVRPANLTDDQGGKQVVEFGDQEKAPSSNVDRSDVAAWICDQVFHPHSSSLPSFGRKVNITSPKQ